MVDDDVVFQNEMAALLQSEGGMMMVCGQADNAEQALHAISFTPVDLVLVNLGLPGGSGLVLIEDLHALHPQLPILAIAVHEEFLLEERVSCAGGRGCLLRQAGPLAMLQSIEETLGLPVNLPEQVFVPPLRQTVGRNGHSPEAGSSKLSAAEFEVLRLIGEGKSCRDVAKELQLSSEEVHDHCLHIKRKFHLRNSAQLSHFAFRYMGTRNEEAALNDE